MGGPSSRSTTRTERITSVSGVLSRCPEPPVCEAPSRLSCSSAASASNTAASSHTDTSPYAHNCAVRIREVWARQSIVHCLTRWSFKKSIMFAVPRCITYRHLCCSCQQSAAAETCKARPDCGKQFARYLSRWEQEGIVFRDDFLQQSRVLQTQGNADDLRVLDVESKQWTLTICMEYILRDFDARAFESCSEDACKGMTSKHECRLRIRAYTS
jgi:hypothetical protein